MKKVIHGCIRGLYGRMSDCKLGMHAKCFDEIQQSMIHDVRSRHNSGSNQIKTLKRCCHHSLRDLCLPTDDDAW